jgi:hypothetical protein
MEIIGLSNEELLPRMSRDFLVKFSDPEAAKNGQQALEKFRMIKDGEKVFEVDNRGNSLFVELVYPNNLDDSMDISNGSVTVKNFKKYVSFVAIKNGEHDGTGYLLSNNGHISGNTIPLTNVYEIIKESCLSLEPLSK